MCPFTLPLQISIPWRCTDLIQIPKLLYIMIESCSIAHFIVPVQSVALDCKYITFTLFCQSAFKIPVFYINAKNARFFGKKRAFFSLFLNNIGCPNYLLSLHFAQQKQQRNPPLLLTQGISFMIHH